MRKSTLFFFSFFVLLIFTGSNIYSQQCKVITNNINFESANSLTFDVVIENTGTADWIYSNGAFAWTINPSFLNGGAPTFTLVPGYSDFQSGAYPLSVLLTNPNILRTSSNMPGSNGMIQPGQSLRLYRFRLQTSASSFSSEYFDAAWKTDAAPYTKIYSWDSGTGTPVEISNIDFSILSLLMEENFNYPVGDLVAGSGGNWVHFSGTGFNIQVSSGSLTYSGYLSSGLYNKIDIISTTSSAEDAYREYTAQTSGTIYAAFLLNLPNTDGIPANTSTTGDYFIAYLPSTSTSFYDARLSIRQGVAANTFQIGMRGSASNSEAAWYTTDLNVGTTYLIVMGYQIVTGSANDIASMWINPPTDGTQPTPNITQTVASDLSDVARFAVRQGTTTPNASIDGIRAGTDWADIFPASGSPFISVLPTALSGFSYVQGGGPSTSQSYNLSGSNLTPASGSISVTAPTDYEISSNNTTFVNILSINYLGGALSATPIYVRLKAGLSGGTYEGELVANAGGGAATQNVTCNGAVIKPEPTNHVTNFTGVLGNPAYYYNNLSWTDATGGTVPDGYLIKKSYIGFSDIVDPVDGVPELDSYSEQNVAQGVQAAVFTGFAGSTYYYKIFPYTNSGVYINYKTDGSVPQFSITNVNAPSLPVTENFNYPTGSNLTDDGWVAHSGAGNFPIQVNATPLTYTGYVNSGLGKSVSLIPPGTASAEDDNRAFDSVYSGSIYASFMLSIDSITTTNVYFFHFGPENSTTLFFGKVFVQGDGSGNLAFGVTKSSNTSAVYTPFNYSLNTTYLIVIKYTFNTGTTTDDEVKLWVDPVLDGTEPPSDLTQTDTQSDATSLGFFALRQASNGPGLTFGGLRVANSWVPASGTTTFPLSVDISNGWNMTSVPGTNPDGMGVANWWADLTGTVYKFVPGSGYTGITTTTPGEGYWMKNSITETYSYPAIQIVTHDPIGATAGWNMFGGFENAADVNTLTTTPSGQIVYPIYKYVPGTGYQAATILNPGYGYWVKVSSNCQISIPSAMAKGNKEVADYFKKDWGKITLTDATGNSYTLYAVKGQVDLNRYELPPLPPAGEFDIRYSSGRIAEDINSTAQGIDLRGVVYPVKVKTDGMDIRLQDVTGKEVNTNVKSGEEVTISNPNINKLMVSENLIPDKYALEQNYPNPFNPSTTIEFSLPENVKNVTVSIYNVLGQKVAELVNGAMAAGSYQHQWNAKDLASGIYIYELRTEKFVSVKKMMLMK